MLKKIALVGSSNLINGFSGLLYLVAVTRALPVFDFGKFAIIVSIFILFSKFTELGTTSSFVALSIKNGLNYRKALIVLKSLLILPVTIASLIALQLFGLFSFRIFLYLILGFLGYILNDYLFAIFQLRRSFFLTSLVNSLPALFKGLFAVLFLSSRLAPSFSFLLLIYLSAFVTNLILVPFIKKELAPQKDLKESIKELCQKGFLGGFSQTINIAIPTINNAIASFLTSFEGVGIFGLAEKISSIFALASYSIFTVILPEDAKKLKETGKYDSKSLFYLSTLIIFSIIFMISISKPVILYIFGYSYERSIPILNLMIVSSGLTAIAGFMDSFFYICEKTSTLLKINLAKVFILVALGIFLTLKFQLLGLALTGLTTSALGLLVTYMIINKLAKENSIGKT